MRASKGSAPLWCLLSAVMLTLPACGSFGTGRQQAMPRSEMVCDRSPPAPMPDVPATHPELEASYRMLQGLYHAEIIKFIEEARCRRAVREENAR